MQKVLVTGGFGYVGSRLVPRLLSQGHEVHVLDLMLYGSAGLEALKGDERWPEYRSRFRLFEGDLRDRTCVRSALVGCDAVIHLAAISNDPTGEIDEVLTRQVNFDAVGMLVALAKESGVRRFINASSSSVFGSRSESSVDETLEPAPLTSYSKYKALSEWIVRAAHSPEFMTVNVRPATICGYSPRQRFDLTVNKLTADAVRKGVITVHGGEQRRPNVGMTDIIALYSQLLTADPEKIGGKTFNFGFENHKVIEIARIIQKQLGESRVRIVIEDVFDHRDYHISSNRISSALGYTPVSSIVKEVENLCARLETDFANVDDPKFYNMKTMNLARSAGAYDGL